MISAPKFRGHISVLLQNRHVTINFKSTIAHEIITIQI
jgi:hypothetical protein